MLRRPGNIRGQTTVEFALAATIFFLITFGLIQFAILYHYKLVLGHATPPARRAPIPAWARRRRTGSRSRPSSAPAR